MRELFYVGQALLLVSLFTPLVVFIGAGVGLLSVLLKGDVWAWVYVIVLAALGIFATKNFYKGNYKQTFALSSLQLIIVFGYFIYMLFGLEQYTSEAVKALGDSDITTQVVGGLALALKPSLGWGWILMLGGPAISVFTAYKQLGSKEELKNVVKEAFSLKNIISAIIFVSIVLMLAFSIDRYIDMREKAKASLILEESIKIANTLLTVEPTNVPEKITLPQAQGRYADLVSKFNKAVEDYHEKLKEFSECGGQIYARLLAPNQSYFEVQMLKLEAITCRRKREQYYKSLTQLNQIYKEVAENLRPSTTLQLNQEDERFRTLNKILDQLQ